MPQSFDDFARSQSDVDEGDLTQLIAVAGPQWKILKKSAAELNGRSYKKHSLAWIEGYSMLSLADVVAQFDERQNRNSLLHDYRVIFARRQDSEIIEPAPYKVTWDLVPEIRGGVFSWRVEDLDKTLPPSELSEEIAIRLAKYHEEYAEGLRNQSFESESFDSE